MCSTRSCWRAVARPTDLFVELGRRLAASGLLAKDVDPVEFSGTRQWAEADARRLLWRSSKSLECNLEQIWEAMPPTLIGNAKVAELVEAELACEADHLGIHPGTAGLLTLAKELGIRTALVSDTYLSSEQLGRVVSAAGFDVAAIDRIVTSSEAGLGKADGLLVKVAAAERIDPRRVLHFGDNAVSDLAAAREAGARGVLADVDPARRAVTRPSPAIVAFADRSGTDGALGAAVRETLVSAGATGDSAAYQFGAGVVGPALAGFANWASETAERHGASTVHCLLREGAVIADLIARTRRNGPATRLVHASRWALVRAAVFDGTPEEIFTVIERRTRFRPAHLASAFDLDPARGPARADRRGVPPRSSLRGDGGGRRRRHVARADRRLLDPPTPQRAHVLRQVARSRTRPARAVRHRLGRQDPGDDRRHPAQRRVHRRRRRALPDAVGDRCQAPPRRGGDAELPPRDSRLGIGGSGRRRGPAPRRDPGTDRHPRDRHIARVRRRRRADLPAGRPRPPRRLVGARSPGCLRRDRDVGTDGTTRGVAVARSGLSSGAARHDRRHDRRSVTVARRRARRVAARRPRR